MDDSLLRKLSATVGLGTVAFGALPIVSPRAFAAVFGLRAPDGPTTEAAFRSLGVRDVAIGLGLWSAAAHGGRYAPWLLARAISDGGDTAACLIAVRHGDRDPRFLALTVIAAGAAVVGATLHLMAGRTMRGAAAAVCASSPAPMGPAASQVSSAAG